MINSQAKEYASVLFELGLDKEQVVSTFDALSKVLENKEIESFFTHPVISKDEKKKIIKESLQLSDCDLLYFLYVLIDNNRMRDIKDIYEAYNDICDEKANIMRLSVTSVASLSDSYKVQIKKVLEKTYEKTVVLDFIIDDKLIGGIVVKHDNQIIDASVLNKINSLKQLLLND